METIAPGDKVATDGIHSTSPFHPNGWSSPVEIMQRNFSAFESQIAAIDQSAADEILHDLLLSVYCHRLPGEFDEWNAMKPTVQSQFDTLVTEAFLLETLRDVCATKHLDACVLKDSGANTLLAIGSGLCLQNDRAYAMQMQQMRKHQSSWTCPDDSYLGLKVRHG